MATYYGIEENTDRKHPQTKVVRLRTLAAVHAFLAKPSEHAFRGAATNDIPASQQNWHHRLRDAYEMPAGWRADKREIDEIVRRYRDSVYRKSEEAAKAMLIRQHGARVEARRAKGTT